MNPPCFDDSELENDNTISRMKDGSKYGKVGFAAEGEICGYPAGSPNTAVPPFGTLPPFGTCEAAGAGSAAETGCTATIVLPELIRTPLMATI